MVNTAKEQAEAAAFNALPANDISIQQRIDERNRQLNAQTGNILVPTSNRHAMHC